MSDDARRFAEELIAALRAAGETRTITFDETAFALDLGAGSAEQDRLLLASAFAEHLHLPRDARKAALERWTVMVRNGRPTGNAALADVIGDILPRVRERTSFGLVALEQELQVARSPEIAALAKEQKVQFQTPHRPIAEVYAAGACHDMPTMVRDVEAAELDRWAISFDDLFEIALANLRRKTRQTSFDRVRAGVYASTWGDSFDATRILLPDLFRELRVTGEPLVFLLQPTRIVVTGSDDSDGIAACVHLADEAARQPRFMGLAPLRLTKDGWTAWCPAYDDAFGPELWELRVARLASAYEAQKQTLDALNEIGGRKTFVASFTAAKGDGRAHTYATWFGNSDETLLPEVDELMLGRGALPDIRIARVPFAKALPVLTPVEGIYPPRFRTRGFPSDAQLDAMGARFFGKGETPPATPTAAGTVRAVKARELAKVLADGDAIALDLRDASAHGRSRLPGAKSFPADTVASRRDELLALGKPVVLYDRAGDRTVATVAKKIASWGIAANWLEGGILAWEMDGLKVER